MANVSLILARKGTQVVSIGPRATVLDAALLMNEHKIGALIVLDDQRGNQLAGIFTERDVLRRVVAKRLDPARTPVEDVMTTEVVTCTPEMSIDDVRGLFMRRRIRHLPVVRDGRLEGIISIGDLNAWQLDGQEQEIYYLHEYIAGRT